MKKFIKLLTLVFLLIGIVSSPAFSKDNKNQEEKCTLKNKVFCGEWEDSQGFHARILGHLILSSDSDPFRQECIIIDEFIDERYPYSILKCTYFHSALKEDITDFIIFSLSPRTEERNKRAIGYYNIFYNSASNIQDLFLWMSGDFDSDGRPILVKNRFGIFMYREVK